MKMMEQLVEIQTEKGGIPRAFSDEKVTRKKLIRSALFQQLFQVRVLPAISLL